MSVRIGLLGEKNRAWIMRFASKVAKIEVFSVKNQLS